MFVVGSTELLCAWKVAILRLLKEECSEEYTYRNIDCIIFYVCESLDFLYELCLLQVLETIEVKLYICILFVEVIRGTII